MGGVNVKKGIHQPGGIPFLIQLNYQVNSSKKQLEALQFTASFMAFPATNFGTIFSAICMVAPV